MLNRRAFLKQTFAATVIGAGLVPVVQGCGHGLRREDLAARLRDSDGARSLEPNEKRVLRYASLAPSGHNTQPWTVRVMKKHEWIIGADPTRRMPVVDSENREMLLSIGAFAENLVTAAAALGYQPSMEVIAGSPFDTDLIRVTLTPAKTVPYPLERIETRRTVKRGLQDRELRAEDVRALSAPLNGRLFYFPRGSSHASCLQEGTVACFRLQTQKDRAQEELATWLRFRDCTARKHRDGLTPEGMEMSGFSGWYVRHFMNPSDALKKSFRERGIDSTAELASQGAGWFVITSAGSSVRDVIETGRRFERMALLAREHGVGIHPMTQLLEEPEGRRRIAENHPKDMTPQFVLRVGYVDPYPGPVSLRRPVEWFLRS
jgi:hypothetical protein